MGITVTEKQELRDIINDRVDKAIARLEHDNTLGITKLREVAKELAVKELELGEFLKKDDDADASIARITKERDKLRDEAADRLGTRRDYRVRDGIDAHIEKAVDIVFDRMLADDEVGKKILALQAEKESMLETVWIATSSEQVKKLFLHVHNVLGESTTALGGMAQAIKPEV